MVNTNIQCYKTTKCNTYINLKLKTPSFIEYGNIYSSVLVNLHTSKYDYNRF